MSFCFCFAAGVGGSPTVAQSPVHKSVNVGDTVSLSCTASSGVDDDLSWYLVKPSTAPRLLFYKPVWYAKPVQQQWIRTRICPDHQWSSG